MEFIKIENSNPMIFKNAKIFNNTRISDDVVISKENEEQIRKETTKFLEFCNGFY